MPMKYNRRCKKEQKKKRRKKRSRPGNVGLYQSISEGLQDSLNDQEEQNVSQKNCEIESRSG